jgi:hypothetical protein
MTGPSVSATRAGRFWFRGRENFTVGERRGLVESLAMQRIEHRDRASDTLNGKGSQMRGPSYG